MKNAVRTVAASAVCALALHGGPAIAENMTTVDAATRVVTVVFDEVGDFIWTAPASQQVELLVVGGGGGGGCGTAGGGGGGGQVYHSTTFSVTGGTTYSVTVGAGGNGGTNGGASVGRWEGKNGGNSVFGSITCLGGGGGGGNGPTESAVIKNGVEGGNSGGANKTSGTYTSPDATGTDDAENGWYGGHKGGDSIKATYEPGVDVYSGGGGGAMGEGGIGAYDAEAGYSRSGNGGDGYACDITGSTVYYACGGGGGADGNESSDYAVYLIGGDGGSGNASGGAGAKAHQWLGSNGMDGTGTGGGGGGWYQTSPTAGGKGGSGIVVLRYTATTPVVAMSVVSGYIGAVDDIGAHVDLIWPEQAKVRYSQSESGPWSETRPAFDTAGVVRTYVKVSARGLADFIAGVDVTVKDPSSENDGTFYFVVPSGTAGNTPTAPYQTWATAANDLQTVVDATAARTNPFTIFVENGTYPIASSLAISNTAATVCGWARGTGRLVTGGAVFDAGRRCRVGTSKAAALKGLAFVNGYVENGYGGGLYVTGPAQDGVLVECVFSNNYVSALAGNTSTQSLGGGVYVNVASTFKDCLFVDNVVTAATDTVSARGGGVYATSKATTYRGCTFLRNVASSNRGSGNGPLGAGLCAGNRITVYDCDFLTNAIVKISGSEAFSAAIQVHHANGANSLVANSRFIGNVCKDKGLLALPHSGSVVTNCLFKDNSCSYGSADFCPLTVGCTFVGNTGIGFFYDLVGKDGGGICRNCFFYNNTAVVWVNTTGTAGSNSSLFENCTFAGNGSVLRYDKDKVRPAYFKNCAFVKNMTDFNVTEVLSTRTLVASNCYFSAEISTNNLTSSHALVFTDDPRFVDEEAGDYRLAPKSPLREMGLMMSWMDGATDLDGNPRVVDKRGRVSADALPDIGCYECQESPAGLTLFVR